MSQAQTDLVRDPLFQLNVLLWLSQPLPEASAITPLLHRCGFTVYAIAPALGVPLDVVLTAQQAGVKIQPNGRPDVVLTHEQKRRFALAECKASSFGPDVQAAEQARAFLLMTGSRAAEVLGLAAEQLSGAILAYAVPEAHRRTLEPTLSKLQSELTGYGLSVGCSTILGFETDTQELAVSIDDAGGAFFDMPAGKHTVMKLQPNTCPRTLYFIPYDPDIMQTDKEREYCNRVLFERIHSAVLVAIGRATPPATLVLRPNDLLNDAMFGMYSLWENRDSAKRMRALCRLLQEQLTVRLQKRSTMTSKPAGESPCRTRSAIDESLTPSLVFPVSLWICASHLSLNYLIN